MLDASRTSLQGGRFDSAEDALCVTVVTPLGFGGRGGIDRLMDELRSIFRQPGYERLKVEFRQSRGPGSIFLSPIYLLNLAAALVWSKIRSRVDVVHINLSQDGSSYRKLLVAWLCRRLSIPYVLHLHGSRYRQFWDNASNPLNRALARMFSKSAAVVVLGTVWKEYVSGKVPSFPADSIVILPTATQDPGVPGLRPEPHPLHILFAGRHGARKGVWDLTEALGNLASDGTWRATLSGDGEYELTKTKLKERGIADRVDVPGWISTQAFTDLLAGTDILVLPSYDENLPLSVVEAFARGIAVICTPVGALTDIVEHEKSGILVEPGNVQGLTEAIRRLLHDGQLRATLGAQARHVYEERLNLDSYAKRLAGVWRAAKVSDVQPPT
jgi:glycosyltransferase involved in cell wall biosynthesis